MRAYESLEIEPLILSEGWIRVPEDVQAWTPEWQSA
jgi:hypothetical protein